MGPYKELLINIINKHDEDIKNVFSKEPEEYSHIIQTNFVLVERIEEGWLKIELLFDSEGRSRISKSLNINDYPIETFFSINSAKEGLYREIIESLTLSGARKLGKDLHDLL